MQSPHDQTVHTDPDLYSDPDFAPRFFAMTFFVEADSAHDAVVKFQGWAGKRESGLCDNADIISAPVTLEAVAFVPDAIGGQNDSEDQ